MTATLCKDGVPVAERELPLPVIAPQTTQSFANPFAGTATEPGAYTLTISIYRTAATDWADAQTEDAFGQYSLNRNAKEWGYTVYPDLKIEKCDRM